MPGHRKRRQFKQTDAFTRGMVIGLKRAGWSIRQIAADTHLGASTVHRLWRRWLEQGNVAIYRNVGATRVTSERVDPSTSSGGPTSHLYRHPATCARHPRSFHLDQNHFPSTWMTEWHRVVFSDESRFCLSSDSRRVRVWRRRGERSNPAAIVERPTVRQRGIMVWGAIAYDSRSPLLRIQGTMTAQRYVDDVLRPVTLPYLQGVPNALYQQDNARPHTARISQQALQDVQMLPWPPYSPDLSPIEHVWDIIGRRLHALPQPRSEDELWQMVEREWRAIPQDAIRTLIDSLPRRFAACIAVRGFHRRVKTKISFEDDDVPIDDETTTKPLFTPQENGRKGTRDKVPRLRWNPWQKHVKSRAKNETAVNIHRDLVSVYGEGCISIQMVRRWRSWFLEGRQNVHDDERSGRPVTATDNAAVAAVRNVVEADRRVTIDEIIIRLPPGIEIGRSSIGTIMILESDTKSLSSLTSGGHSRRSSDTSQLTPDDDEDAWEAWGKLVADWDQSAVAKKNPTLLKRVQRRCEAKVLHVLVRILETLTDNVTIRRSRREFNEDVRPRFCTSSFEF
ncbi:hypothetical protein LAZ67_7001266 [Cordylochernes scorpioides]|uniref:Tc1-like transposase DDE domain-containing protein n=1 Tax=Cordylochernes scorpioides TaxID=51811 RepID=A0ABY6KM49_9ARAC|nr:hypothetical protein LAZ67_7001266 [Cordylochernes scorpioides]